MTFEIRFPPIVSEQIASFGLPDGLLREFYFKVEEILKDNAAFGFIEKIDGFWQLVVNVEETSALSHQFVLNIRLYDEVFHIESVRHRRRETKKRG